MCISRPSISEMMVLYHVTIDRLSEQRQHQRAPLKFWGGFFFFFLQQETEFLRISTAGSLMWRRYTVTHSSALIINMDVRFSPLPSVFSPPSLFKKSQWSVSPAHITVVCATKWHIRVQKKSMDVREYGAWIPVPLPALVNHVTVLVDGGHLAKATLICTININMV